MRRITAILLLAAAICIAGCGEKTVVSDGVEAAVSVVPAASSLAPVPVLSAEPSAAPATQKATIAAVGDLMVMATQIGMAKTEDGYDFNPVFELISPYIQEADIAVANLETTVAGKDAGFSVSGTTMPDGTTSLSYFNAPTQLLDALKSAGFDILGTANNHVLDKGRDGLEATIRNIRAAGLDCVGTNLADENVRYILQEANGIRFAVLAYTQGTNKHSGGYSSDELVRAVHLINDSQVIADMQAARDAGADVLVLCLHTGTEKMTEPGADEVERAKKYIAEGADILFQSHPHVLQPMEMVQAGGRTGFVAYSLGNFMSNMEGDQYARAAVVMVDVEKDAKGARITGARYLPTYFYRGDVYKVLPALPGAIPDVRQAIGESAAKTAQGAYERTVAFLGSEAAVPLG